MAVNIKFTKFDNTPWGFRLAGGSDFPQPLTVIRVTEGGLAECMGLKVGDVVVRLNDQPISNLTHGQAHEELTRAGNNFVLGVLREGDSLRSVEAFSDENIVPYKIPLADLPPVFPEEILKEETVIERYEEIKTVEVEAKPEVEPLPDKPKDANSEIVPNQNLTDDEIAQLILEEEELLTDKGLLGVNFNKLRPRVTALKQSKVIEELQSIATAEPPLVEQLRRTSVFLQKPQRPIPVPRKKQEEEATEEEAAESYKVVIKKQKKRSVTDRLLERGLLKPEGASTPEPPTPEVNMEMEAKIEEDDSSIVPSIQLDDSSLLQEPLEPTATFSVESSSSVEPPLETICQSRSPVQVQVELELELELELEPEVETPRDDSESDVASLQLMSTRKESNLALPRKAASKRKSKRFYTRADYFRRCLFGKKSCAEVKGATKARPSSLRERGAQQLEDPARGRRSSIEMCSKSRIKGRYLETYLKREDNWMRRMIDGLLEKPSSFCSSKSFDRLLASREISFRRTRYAEKILLRSIEFVAVRLRSDILQRLKQPCSSPLAFNSRIRKRLYSKGRYFERIFWRVVGRLMSCMKGLGTAQPYDSKVRGRDRRRSSAMIKTKGRYLQTYLSRTAFFDLGDSFATHPTVVSSKRKLFARTRYVERILKKHLQCLGLIVSYVRCRILQGISDSSIVIPAGSSLNSRQSDASLKGDDVLSNLIRSSTGFISNEVFHRGSRRLSRSSRGSVSLPSDSSTWANYLCSWLPLKCARESSETVISEKKTIEDSDRDSRRLSFVPTILYEGLTNRIGVDFTRLVAYAFIPCTSIILLYMYK